MVKTIKLICLQLVLALAVSGQSASIQVHDPVMIKQDSTYYIFCTGWGISVWSSTDMKNWKAQKPVFPQAPGWALKAVPGFKGHIWAPDISFFKGRYVLFYSVSAFGKNTSCIGLASNKTLNPLSTDFQWQDQGKIIESIPGKDDWNAIDPNLVTDDNGKPWLSFGSFWSGIKLVQLKNDLSGLLVKPEFIALASRPRSNATDLSNAGDGAIEAPFIIRHGNYFYLFASVDYCCRGNNSNYKVIVGRSDNITGPYTDNTGRSLLQGGGTLVIQGDHNWPGVGHNGLCSSDGLDYMVFHAYDAGDKGKPKLMIRKMKWDNQGWPIVVL
jgi:arabinan endo-1,5-alpha-L-arabinosidase